MPNTRLGKVSVTPKGDFVLGTAYERLDVVYSDSDKASFLAKRDNRDVPLTDTDVWMMLAQGVQGIQGIQGVKGDPFQIQKTYSSIAEMNADFATDQVEQGQFVSISAASVDDPDNGKLYCKGKSSWEFVVDLSGPTGARGPQGEMPTIEAGATTTGQPGTKAAVSIEPTETGVSVSFTIPEGEKGSPLKVAGSYDTTEELVAAFPNGDGENSYLVSGIIHVWDGAAWKGTGGVDNYEVLRNKPQIGGISLEGTKALEDLGIQSKVGHEQDVQRIANAMLNLSTASNMLNGYADGSVRTNGAAEETESYKLGANAFAEGGNTFALGENSHTEGNNTKAMGDAAHAEGHFTFCDCSYGGHSEGLGTIAATTKCVIPIVSYSEATLTAASDGTISYLATAFAKILPGMKALIYNSYFEQATFDEYIIQSVDATNFTITLDRILPATDFEVKYVVIPEIRDTGNCFTAHSEGNWTAALGVYSHSEGSYSLASGSCSHAEGSGTKAIGETSHAEGYRTKAAGETSHTEGYLTKATGSSSHAEGVATIASGHNSHAEGYATKASGRSSHAEGDGAVASGDYSHAEGDEAVASGICSHAGGYLSAASGDYSFAEGYICTAKGKASYAEGSYTYCDGHGGHSEGLTTLASAAQCAFPIVSFSANTLTISTNNATHYLESAFTKIKVGMQAIVLIFDYNGGTQRIYKINSIDNTNYTITLDNKILTGSMYIVIPEIAAVGNVAHSEGMLSAALGAYSHSEGGRTLASGQSSHAEGYATTAFGHNSHAEGEEVVASGECSHAEGCQTLASGRYSHAEGANTTASGYYSHTEGAHTTASGMASHAGGYYSISNGYQYAFGHFNLGSTGGDYAHTGGSALVIGNGTADTARSNCFRVQYNGQVFSKGNYSTTGADYAELFEWEDGNPNKEDRRGHFVALRGNKIHIAQPGEIAIGVISSTAAMIGNNHSETWQGMYLTNVWGDVLTEYKEIPAKYEVIEHPAEVTFDEEGKETILTEAWEEKVEIEPEFKGQVPILNPDYNPNEKYVPRHERPEWGIVGLLGQLIAIDDGTCQVDGFCGCSEDGTATRAEKGYRVIERLDGSHIRILASFL